MPCRTTIGASVLALLCLGALSTTFAQQLGTPQEARAILDKAVSAVKADQAVALAMFNKGEVASETVTFTRSASGSVMEKQSRALLPYLPAQTLGR